ncbi:MAG: FAD-dependent oxidoreductase, partial [Clostridia bacterium]|nr:FAD-dependent oxidoreductase [Clostridia bacterium]
VGAPDRVMTTPPWMGYIKIAEGCDNCCSFCAIPAIRGPYRSRPMEELVDEVRWMASQGVKELILIAQDTTRYGEDLYGKPSLPELLKAVCRVEGIEWADNHYVIRTNQGNVEAKYIVNAAGVNSGRIHEMVAEKTFEIRPNRGEYYVMDKCEVTRAKHTLFQCPNENGKGVLVSPTVGGNLIVGPNAEGVSGEEDTHNTSSGMAFVQKMAAKSVPTINYRNSIRNFAGVRANLNKDEFQIGVAAKNFIDLAGIKSPGLSSAPAIALECVSLLQGEGLVMERKESPVTTRKHIHFRKLSAEEKQKVIAENPLYGRVICRCETITEGEIVDAIHSPIPPCSIDGIKRRAGSGLGRCQGGFCGPRVLDILARELKVSPLDILQDKDGSFILMNETKKEV